MNNGIITYEIARFPVATWRERLRGGRFLIISNFLVLILQREILKSRTELKRKINE